MLRIALAALALLGATPAAAIPADEARHLLGRVGFAATPAAIEALAPLDRRAAVRDLVRRAKVSATTPPPAALRTPVPRPGKGKMKSKATRKAFRKTLRQRAKTLRTWWLTEMLTTPAPITEVMTLFWHNHFTSGLKTVKRATLMLDQNALLRRHALGDFRALLRAILRDPAMLRYLDGISNTRKAPNENLARELLELFTLGEGAYSERDIKEVARALTGLSIDRRTGRFVFRARRHDPGRKTILGQSGRFDADAVVDLLMARPETGRRIATKLWIAFVHETPDPAVIERLGAQFRRDPHIGRLLEALLLTDAFWAPETRGRLIKSPVDLVVGTARTFRLPASWAPELLRLTDLLGQKILQPPNVKGWPGGTAWITTQSLVDRQSALQRFGDAGMRNADSPIRAWLGGLPPAWRTGQQVARLLLPGAPADVEVLDRDPSAALVRQLLQDPVYQLK